METAQAIITVFVATLTVACSGIDNRSEPTYTGERTRILYADFNVAGITKSALILFPEHLTDISARAFTEGLLLGIESIRERTQIKVRIAAAIAFSEAQNSEYHPVLAEDDDDNEPDDADQICC